MDIYIVEERLAWLDAMHRDSARRKLLYYSDLSFYNFSTDSENLLATYNQASFVPKL